MPLELNLIRLAPLLESEKQYTKKEFLDHARSFLNPSEKRNRTLLQILGGLDFFSVIKDQLGRVLVL